MSGAREILIAETRGVLDAAAVLDDDDETDAHAGGGARSPWMSRTVMAEDGAEAWKVISREPGRFRSVAPPRSRCRSWTGSRWRAGEARDFPDLTILLMTGFAAQRERDAGSNASVHDVSTSRYRWHDSRTAVATRCREGKGLAAAA